MVTLCSVWRNSRRYSKTYEIPSAPHGRQGLPWILALLLMESSRQINGEHASNSIFLCRSWECGKLQMNETSPMNCAVDAKRWLKVWCYQWQSDGLSHTECQKNMHKNTSDTWWNTFIHWGNFALTMIFILCTTTHYTSLTFCEGSGPCTDGGCSPLNVLLEFFKKLTPTSKLVSGSISFREINLTIPLGQLEITVMNTFCAVSELKVFLQHPGCPKALRACAPILANCFPDMERGTLDHDIQTLGEENYVQHQKGKTVHLEEDVRNALVDTLQSQSALMQGVWEHNQLEFQGWKVVSAQTTYCNSIVFFQPSRVAELVPGVFRTIIEVGPIERPLFFLTIHRYLPSASDIFQKYPDFGATIRSKQTHENVEMIPITNRIYAENQHSWENSQIVVCPLIEVSYILLKSQPWWHKNSRTIKSQ